jgi:hypothetical protein
MIRSPASRRDRISELQAPQLKTFSTQSTRRGHQYLKLPIALAAAAVAHAACEHGLDNRAEDIPASIEHIRAGKLRALAVATAMRSFEPEGRASSMAVVA